ncbi:hypothetical protein EDB86DRAFT_2870603 [Lactarius hatsudake]|nr:hypothetical protein EDB86DRAFT_2870603 [Lactarius hatsudake]
MQPPPKRPENEVEIKAVGVILAEKCYIVRAGKEHWLAQVRDDGTSKDIVRLKEHKIEHLAVSADGSNLASLSFYQGKILLEIADLKSRRATKTFPVVLHDSFRVTDCDVCHMGFSATKRHITIVFFLRATETSYICTCDLKTGTLRWNQWPRMRRPLVARSLRGEELTVVGKRDLWKVNLETMTGSIQHKLPSQDGYRSATCYVKFTDPTDRSSSSAPVLLEMASRLWIYTGCGIQRPSRARRRRRCRSNARQHISKFAIRTCLGIGCSTIWARGFAASPRSTAPGGV